MNRSTMRMALFRLRQIPFYLAVMALALGLELRWARADQIKSGEHSSWGQILVITDAQDSGSNIRAAELYDPATNRFIATGAQLQGLGGATATEITAGKEAGKILVAGGGTGVSGLLNSSELYDPATGRFSAGPEMNDRRDDHTATTIRLGRRAGWILIVGGEFTNLYDPFTNRFHDGPKNPGPRWDHTATVIPSGPNVGKVLLAGGWWEEVRELAWCEIYDPVNNAFVVGKRAPHFNVARSFQTATLLTIGPNAGKILFTGGRGRTRKRLDPLNSTELYDPATNSFAPARETTRMLTPRVHHTATIITSGPRTGMILIAGGGTGVGESLASTELYDPRNNRFMAGPMMLERRSGHLAISIRTGPNAGKILIVGGADLKCPDTIYANCRAQFLKSTELYNPLTNSFEPGPDLMGPWATSLAQLPPAPRREGGK